MSGIDVTMAAASMLALSVAAERLIEALWIVLEAIFLLSVRPGSSNDAFWFLSQTQTEINDDEVAKRRQQRYQKVKRFVSIPIGVGIGIGLALAGPTLGAPFTGVATGALAAIGALAGFLAPYSHALIQLGFQTAQASKS